MSEHYIGISKELELFRERLVKLSEGEGSIISVTGEEGYGKSYLLSVFAEEAAKKKYETDVYLESNSAPVGKLNIGSIQSLSPFTRVLEKIMEGKKFDTRSAKSKFLKNAGMTVLASAPFVDIVFYAIKEFGRDWRQYKSDKSSEKIKKSVNQAIKDYYDSLVSFAEKTPLVILFDDFHWSDAQSIELIDALSENIKNIPLIIVFACKESVLENQASPALSFIKEKADKEPGVFGVRLKEFSQEELRTLTKRYIKGYKSSPEFENWLMENTLGNPGVATEYLKYFQDNPPFDEGGELKEGFAESEYLPASLHAAFSDSVEKLTEEDKNLLSMCSAEGREFTVLIASNLLNADLLSTIRRLKKLQNDTGVIKSIGARWRYGVKTTVYEFTQAYYAKYFKDLLEYEEKLAIHSQIASLLKQKYDEAETEETRKRIAPYLAAHSLESEDEETAKTMLVEAARTAKEFGDTKAVESLYDNFVELSGGGEGAPGEDPDHMAFKTMLEPAAESKTNGEAEGDSGDYSAAASAPQFIDFGETRKIIIGYYQNKKYRNAAEYALWYLRNNEKDLTDSERAQLLSLAAKSYAEDRALDKAEGLVENVREIIKNNGDPFIETIYLNSLAALKIYQNDMDAAYDTLKSAAQKALTLSPELRLLTLSNIMILLKDKQPTKSKRYYASIKKLLDSLNYERFESDLREMM